VIRDSLDLFANIIFASVIAARDLIAIALGLSFFRRGLRIRFVPMGEYYDVRVW
jgi:hypothetical protein